MKRKKMTAIVVLALGLMLSMAMVGKAEPMGTTWTYQGRVMDANNNADGLYDFQFKLFDGPNTLTAEQMGDTIYVNDMDVIEGYFTVELDFGNVFTGDARWLQIGVRPGDSNDVYTNLSPTQAITPAPYATYAQTAGADNDWMVVGSDMYSIPSGDVGIGTTSPSAKLDVDGDVSTSSVYKIQGDTVLSAPGTTNIFVGVGAGPNNTIGNENTFLGNLAGFSNTSGDENIFLGFAAGYYNINGDENTFVGNYAGRSNTLGLSNTFLGRSAGYSNTTGWNNTFLGKNAGLNNTTGYCNTFLGFNAGHSNTTSQNNTFLGYQAGYENTTGNWNTFVGRNAGYSNTTGTGNVCIGARAGFYQTGSNKLYIANSSGTPLIYGDFSTDRVGIGTTSPTAKLHIGGTAGVDGIRFPDGTLRTTAAGNSLDQAYDQGGAGLGRTITADAGAVNIAGPDGLTVNGKVGIGKTSPLYKLDIEGGATPLQITGGLAFKKLRFDIETGGYSVLRIFDNNTSGEDFRLATNGDSWLNGPDNVGIGTTSPGSKLHVVGGCITGSMCSDIRLKKNIVPLPADDSILDRVMGLQAVTFEWKHQVDGKRQIGLIAQDVEEVFPEVVTTPDDGSCEKGLLATGMDAVLIEGIKELKVENKILKDRIEALERTINLLAKAKEFEL
ncbi:MAG: tail fiber domain-containing protein [Planctomycetota bacterium]|jgi:hypothetical protein